MENDLIAKGIIPQTLSWPKRARYYFYAHGGTLDPDTGIFVTSDVLRETAQRLDDAMRRTEEGTFQPNRENDELTYALGNAEHTGRTRGVGVVPWKYGFSEDLETYRSRCRNKAVVTEKIRTLEYWIISLEATVGQRSANQLPMWRSAPPLSVVAVLLPRSTLIWVPTGQGTPLTKSPLGPNVSFWFFMGKSSKFVLRVMRKSKKRAGQYIASRFLKDSPESLLTELLKSAGKTWTSRSL